MAGRPNATFPASDNTVPLPQSDVDVILARMADGGFTPAELIHLLASHTIARSDTLVPGHQAVPFDTTPFTFDTQIFLEVLLKGVGVPFGVNNTDGAEVDSPIPQSNEMRLQSDFALARDSVSLLHLFVLDKSTDISFSALLASGRAWLTTSSS